MTILSDDGRNPLGMKRGGNEEQEENIDVFYQISCHFSQKRSGRAFWRTWPLQSLGCWLVGLGSDYKGARVVTRRRSKERLQTQCNCVVVVSACVSRC